MKLKRMNSLRPRLVAFGLAGLLGGSALVASASTASASAKKSPIVLGFLGDFSGATAFLDNPYMAGLQSRFDQVNKAGGIDGHPVEIQSTDSTDQLAQVQAGFRKLESTKALAIIAGGLQQNTFTLVPIADQDKITLTYYSATPNLYGNKYFFGTATPSPRLGSAEASFMMAKLKAQGIAHPKIAILGFQAPWFQTASKVVAKQGGTVVADVEAPLSAPDPAGGATKVAAAHPDGVLLGELDPSIPTAVSTLKAQGFHGPMVDITGIGYAALHTLNNPNFYVTSEAIQPGFSKYPGMSTVLQAAKQAKQNSTANLNSGFFTNGYLDGLLFVKALEKCGPKCTRTQFPAALQAVGLTWKELDGLGAPRGNAGSSHQLMTGLAIVHVVNGNIKRVTPWENWGVKP